MVEKVISMLLQEEIKACSGGKIESRKRRAEVEVYKILAW